MLNLQGLTTESRNTKTLNLDSMTAVEIATAMNAEDNRVVLAVHQAIPQIAKAIECAHNSFDQGGRLIYIGAGTSGRMGILDSVECKPTFGVPDGMVIGVLAGGPGAVFKAVEGAEDSPELGAEDLQKLNLCRSDVAVGIAASGRTPYVIGALEYAKKMHAATVGVACNRGSEIAALADIAIEAEVGPEVLTGSTRLKAGTAQKMILNMISTGAMTGIGKVYQNLMVDVMPTNEKLRTRANRIVMEATGTDSDTAKSLLDAASGNIKTAIVMHLLNCPAQEAEERLKRSRGHVQKALQGEK